MRIHFGNMPPNVCSFNIGDRPVLQFDSNALIAAYTQGKDANAELKNVLRHGINSVGLQMTDQHEKDLDAVVSKYLSILLNSPR